LQQVADARRAVAEVRDLERGSLRLVATTTVGTYVLPRILGSFHKVHPGVSLELDVTNDGRSIEALRHNRADLAILGPVEDIEDMEVDDFLENRLFFAVAPEHPLHEQGTVTFDDLARHAILNREKGSGTRTVLGQLFAEHGLKPQVAMELRHSAAIKQAVMAGLGVGLLSEHETGPERANGLLCAVDVKDLQINHDWHIVHRRTRPLPRAAIAFKAELLRYAAGFRQQARDEAVPCAPGA
jgi:DNA-binding transcriptional LysR family regulator